MNAEKTDWLFLGNSSLQGERVIWLRETVPSGHMGMGKDYSRVITPDSQKWVKSFGTYFFKCRQPNCLKIKK